MSKIKVFIDPGHGGADPGAVANGLREKDLVLTIAREMKRQLETYENIEVRMSREDDRTLTLAQRVKMANDWGATVFISVHINAGGGVGFESFIWNGANVSRTSVSNQNVIHPEIMQQIKGTDRGRKRANFYVVRQTKMPALLTEGAFIDNARDAARLKDPNFLRLLATGHVNGLVKTYGLKRKAATNPTKPTAPTPAPTTGNGVHVVQSGETLSGIASRYNTTVRELQTLNGIANANVIRVGQRLQIPGTTYTVKAGDTLSGIASRYNTTVTQLQRLNGIANANVIRVGQTLRVR